MEIICKLLSELDHKQKEVVKEQIKNIFFLSTSKTEFESSEHRELFFNKWCGDYLAFYESWVILALDVNSGQLLGYLTGCPDTLSSLERLRVPGIQTFVDLYERFPAHLHINFHPDARGMGMGSILMSDFMKRLKDEAIQGVHLITSPDAKNVSFYDKLLFSTTQERMYNGYSLFFMGRQLVDT